MRTTDIHLSDLYDTDTWGKGGGERERERERIMLRSAPSELKDSARRYSTHAGNILQITGVKKNDFPIERERENSKTFL